MLLQAQNASKEYQITVKSNLIVCDYLYGFCCSFRRRRKEDDSRVSSSPGPGPAVVNSPRGPQFDLEDDAFPPLPGLEASLPQPPPVPVEPPPEVNQPASASQSHRENRSLEEKINFTAIFWGSFQGWAIQQYQWISDSLESHLALLGLFFTDLLFIRFNRNNKITLNQ